MSTFGLRFFDGDGTEWRLLQIAPGPRLTLAAGGRTYWTVPPFGLPDGVAWEPFEASQGRVYESEADAREVGDALCKAAAESRARLCQRDGEANAR